MNTTLATPMEKTTSSHPGEEPSSMGSSRTDGEKNASRPTTTRTTWMSRSAMAIAPRRS
jgi:hypothetical protein